VSGADTRAALMGGAMRHLGVVAPAADGPPAGSPPPAGATPPPPPPAATAPSAGAATKPAAKKKVLPISITRRTLRMDKRGRFAVRVRCPESTSSHVCRGTIRVVSGKTVLARRTFSIKADRATTMRLTLTKAGKALLRRTSRVSVSVRVDSRGRDGVARRDSERLTLRR
jgi:hypothetical protein